MPSVDLHSHILPGVDDGPRTLEGSLELARAAVEKGTAEIVATPHINEDHFIAPLDVAPAVARLTEAVRGAGIDLAIRTGGEIALGRLPGLDDAELASIALGGGPYLLLESPFAMAAGAFETTISQAQSRGYRVLLAHPERSPSFQRDPGRLVALVRSGVLVQITAGSLLGDFGERPRRAASRLLREDLVHVVASDAHNHDVRPPGLDEAVSAAEADVPGIGERAEWLTRDVPAAILAGEPIPQVAPLPRARKGARGRFARHR